MIAYSMYFTRIVDGVIENYFIGSNDLTKFQEVMKRMSDVSLYKIGDTSDMLNDKEILNEMGIFFDVDRIKSRTTDYIARLRIEINDEGWQEKTYTLEDFLK